MAGRPPTKVWAVPEPREPLLEPVQEPESPGAAIEQAAEQAAEAHQAAVAAKASAPPGEAGKQDSLWRHRDFMLLWGGQTVSEMGSSVTQLALPLTAVVLLQASTFEVALLTSAATAAFALIALPAGAIVDRHAKRGIMLACDAARVLIIGSVPLAWALGVLTLWQLYVVALAAGVATVFFYVSYQSPRIHSAIHGKICPGNVRGLRTRDKRNQNRDLINAP